MLELAAKAADDVAVGLAERVRDALAPVVADDLGAARPAGSSRGGGSSIASSATGSSASPPKPSRSRISAAAARRSAGAGCWSS